MNIFDPAIYSAPGSDPTELVIREAVCRIKFNLEKHLADLSDALITLEKPQELEVINPEAREFPAIEVGWSETRRVEITDAEDDDCSDVKFFVDLEIDLAITGADDELEALYFGWLRYAEAIRRALRESGGHAAPWSKLSFTDARFIEQGTFGDTSLHLRRGVVLLTVECGG